MPKRKSIVNEKQYSLSNKRIQNLPNVNTLDDLIKLGDNYKTYKNINTSMLLNILPHLKELNKMIGMKSLKETVFLQVIYYLKNMHTKNDDYLHTMITGEPGTGKTSCAKIISKIYQSMNILSINGPFVIAHREDFIAGFLGQTAIKTKKLLESCIGGVLFVDEVYSLGPTDNGKDMFSNEAIETIVAFLSENKNFCFIGAGYEEEIVKRFFASNKGLERRFQWIHKIEKYNETELTDIMFKMISDINWYIEVDKNDITLIIKNNMDLFKNSAGDIEKFISKCKIIHTKRIFTLDNKYRFIFTKNDIEETVSFLKKIKDKTKEDSTFLNMYI